MSNTYISIPIQQTQVTDDLREKYIHNSPYPHIAIDNFLNAEIIEKVLADFPAVHDQGWIHYLHFNERKHGLNKKDLLPDSAKSLISELNSPDFIAFLEKISGIPNLKADDSMEGSAHRAVGQWGSRLRDEEARRKIGKPQMLPSRRIAAQSLGSAGIDRDQSGLAELCFADHKPWRVRIQCHVGVAQAHCFAGAETTASQQPDQCGVGMRP